MKNAVSTRTLLAWGIVTVALAATAAVGMRTIGVDASQAAAQPAGQAGRGVGGAGEANYVWPTPTDADLRLVRDALDIHTHLDHDSAGPHSSQQARSIDVIDAAKRAKALGMRGFVIKQHYDQSAQLAYVVRKEVPGVEVFGLVGQNLAIGGVNPAAVYHMAEVKGGWGRVVMMPT